MDLKSFFAGAVTGTVFLVTSFLVGYNFAVHGQKARTSNSRYAADPLPEPGVASNGFCVLASDIGSAYSVNEMVNLAKAGHFGFVIIDWAWITYHWERTDFAAVGAMVDSLNGIGCEPIAMYRPRFLSDPVVPIQETREGAPASSHGFLIRFTNPESRAWGISWGAEILRKCPGFKEIIIYNPLNIDQSSEANGVDPNEAVARFLAEAKNAWRQIKPDVQLGVVHVADQNFWKTTAPVIDSAYPFVSVRNDVNPVDEVEAVLRIRPVLNEKLRAALAKITWGEDDTADPVTLKAFFDKIKEMKLNHAIWTIETLIDKYSRDDAAQTLNVKVDQLEFGTQTAQKKESTTEIPAAAPSRPLPSFLSGPIKEIPSPSLAMPPPQKSATKLPWPHQTPEQAQVKAMSRNIWVINDFPLYQSGNTNAYFHAGLDIVLENGTPIYAMQDGYVRSTDYSTVIIADVPGDAPSFAWSYTHLGDLKAQKGAHVRQGDLIGRVDFHGLPHVHLERIYSQEPYWGTWCYTVAPYNYFTFPDDDPPVIQSPFYFFRNESEVLFDSGVGQVPIVNGEVDIVVAMRDPGLYARSRDNGFGDRLGVGSINYEIRSVKTGKSRKVASFDFTQLTIKKATLDRDFNTQFTRIVYKNPLQFAPEPASYDKIFNYYIITNCPHDPPRELKWEYSESSWDTTAVDDKGNPIFPDGEYEIIVTAGDFKKNSSTARTGVVIRQKP